jgi:glycosyltransferase involved in cell wall biosynthesis
LRSLAARCGVEKSIEWQLRFIPDKEVPGLLARSRVVVFPYREIDASGALMSVLPYGKAIVASRLGLFAELLRHGETALLVEPNSPAALASALAAVVENRTMAVEMGRRARTLAAEVCSWDRIAGLTLQAYRETISSRAGRSEWAK